MDRVLAPDVLAGGGGMASEFVGAEGIRRRPGMAAKKILFQE